jgi:Protein of unknown function (DUF5672)
MNTFDVFKSVQWEHDFKTHPARSRLEGVIIETRRHPDMRYALENFSCHFPWAALTIMCSDENKDFIYEIIGHDTNIHVINFPLNGQFTIAKFSDVLAGPDFWENFSSERVLFFMTDTGIRKNDILRFFKYDWVGAPWHHFPIGDPRVFQGNGAFSIRNPRLCRLAAARARPGHLAEDVFFSACFGTGLVKACLPTRSEAVRFATESEEYPDVMGFHNAQTYRKTSDMIWSGYEGPTRRLFHVTEARADDEDVTDLIRLGIGARGLRIGKGALIAKGAKTLTIDGRTWPLEDGFVKDDIFIE